MGRGVGSGKRKFDIVFEMRLGMVMKCCGFIVIFILECDNWGKKWINKEEFVFFVRYLICLD